MPSHFWEDATGSEEPRAGDRDREVTGFLLCIFLFLFNLELCNNVLPIQKKKKTQTRRKSASSRGPRTSRLVPPEGQSQEHSQASSPGPHCPSSESANEMYSRFALAPGPRRGLVLLQAHKNCSVPSPSANLHQSLAPNWGRSL